MTRIHRPLKFTLGSPDKSRQRHLNHDAGAIPKRRNDG